ncbi:MAG: hypothetical protein H6741_00970 [Alphaproteobacteria bacterium]|nr:hypothetical protein [Alphaproteobacteria bacterium]
MLFGPPIRLLYQAHRTGQRLGLSVHSDKFWVSMVLEKRHVAYAAGVPELLSSLRAPRFDPDALNGVMGRDMGLAIRAGHSATEVIEAACVGVGRFLASLVDDRDVTAHIDPNPMALSEALPMPRSAITLLSEGLAELRPSSFVAARFEDDRHHLVVAKVPDDTYLIDLDPITLRTLRLVRQPVPLGDLAARSGRNQPRRTEHFWRSFDLLHALGLLELLRPDVGARARFVSSDIGGWEQGVSRPPPRTPAARPARRPTHDSRPERVAPQVGRPVARMAEPTPELGRPVARREAPPRAPWDRPSTSGETLIPETRSSETLIPETRSLFEEPAPPNATFLFEDLSALDDGNDGVMETFEADESSEAWSADALDDGSFATLGEPEDSDVELSLPEDSEASSFELGEGDALSFDLGEEDALSFDLGGEEASFELGQEVSFDLGGEEDALSFDLGDGEAVSFELEDPEPGPPRSEDTSLAAVLEEIEDEDPATSLEFFFGAEDAATEDVVEDEDPAGSLPSDSELDDLLRDFEHPGEEAGGVLDLLGEGPGAGPSRTLSLNDLSSPEQLQNAIDARQEAAGERGGLMALLEDDEITTGFEEPQIIVEDEDEEDSWVGSIPPLQSAEDDEDDEDPISEIHASAEAVLDQVAPHQGGAFAPVTAEELLEMSALCAELNPLAILRLNLDQLDGMLTLDGVRQAFQRERRRYDPLHFTTKTREVREAVQALDEILRASREALRDPAIVAMWVRALRAFAEEREPPGAQDLVEARRHFERAQALAFQRDWRGASLAVTEALQRWPGQPRVRLLQVFCEVAQRRISPMDGVFNIDSMWLIEPAEQALAQVTAGRLLKASGRSAQAVARFRAALELDPDREDARRELDAAQH